MLILLVGVWLFGMFVVAEDPAFLDNQAYLDVAWSLRLSSDGPCYGPDDSWENGTTTLVLA